MAQITLNSSGVASNGTLALQSNGTTTAVTIDASQNVGLGVTPSAWFSGTKAVQLLGATFTSTASTGYLYQNSYLDTNTVEKYYANGFASKATLSSGGHQWFTAASGTAGNTISFTQAMTLDASGNLGVGITTPVSPLTAARGNVTGAGQWASSAIAVYNPTNTGSYSQISFGYTIGTTNAAAYIGYVSTNQGTNGYGDLVFGTRAVNTDTQPTERARIDSSGNVGIGTNSPQAKLQVAGASNATVLKVSATDQGSGTLSLGDGSSTTNNVGVYRGQPAALSNGSFLNLGGYDGIAFTTGNFALGSQSECARIDSSGNLLVGNTSAGDGKVRISASANAFNLLKMDDTGSINGNYIQFLNSAGNQAGSINHNGTTTVNYGSGSDYRLKHDIAPMQGALEKVALLKPCTYKWNADSVKGEGFIAHELQKVVPEAVVGQKDEIDAEGNPKYQTVDTSFVVATLTAAIQEQQALITSLTARVAQLESN